MKDIEKLVVKALEKEQETHIWDRWVRLCPYMELGQINFITFEDYKNALLKPKEKVSEKTSEEIMVEMMAVMSAHENDTKQAAF